MYMGMLINFVVVVVVVFTNRASLPERDDVLRCIVGDMHERSERWIKCRKGEY